MYNTTEKICKFAVFRTFEVTYIKWQPVPELNKSLSFKAAETAESKCQFTHLLDGRKVEHRKTFYWTAFWLSCPRSSSELLIWLKRKNWIYDGNSSMPAKKQNGNKSWIDNEMP